MTERELKNHRIKESLAKTREKRKTQKCKVFELKLDVSHFNSKTKETLKMMFVEAKWLYNYYLSQEDIFKIDTKINKVLHKDKNGNDIESDLKYLTAKYKSSIYEVLKTSIKALSSIKKRGGKVGKLKFKSQYNSIELNQYNQTHRIVSKNKIKIQGIKQHLKVSGLDQIKPEYEIANAKLVKKASGYYIKLTCFEFIKPSVFSNTVKKDIGLDFGIKDSIITSDGVKFKVFIEESERLKKLQRKFAKTKKGSNNRYKLRLKVQKEYERIVNRRNDAGNKIVNYLLTNYSTVYFQDEMIKAWHSGRFGRAVQNSCLGRVKAKLKASPNTVMIERSFPSTKLCLNCGTLNTLTLADRTYKCSCGYEEDRDIKSAKTILHVGRCKTNNVPMGYRDFKPVENKTSVNFDLSKFVSYDSAKQEAQGFILE
jgi:putative transposase